MKTWCVFFLFFVFAAERRRFGGKTLACVRVLTLCDTFFVLFFVCGSWLNLDEFRCRNGSSGYAATSKRRVIVKCG